jgi:hypothetical protein
MKTIDAILLSFFLTLIVACVLAFLFAGPNSPVFGICCLLLVSEALDVVRIWSHRRTFISKLKTTALRFVAGKPDVFTGRIQSEESSRYIEVPSRETFFWFIPEIETWEITNTIQLEPESYPCILEFEGTPSELVRKGLLDSVDRNVELMKITNCRPHPRKLRG